ncbi:MAG: site-2 protease family protein [Deltaproteobacteria bacterium]|nr:site-2 protease family protein [Deltaproteobacteria bacterium]
MPAEHPQADLQAPPHKLWLHAALFFTTCATTFYAGTFSGGKYFSIGDGLMFMAAIMGILLVHEMGHFTAARLHRVDASLPYFIPLPLPPIGTLGAVIRMRRPPDTRAAVLDIGAAGPLAGLIVAVPVCYAGLVLSEVQPISNLPQGAIMEGHSLLYGALKFLAHPGMGAGEDVFLHPIAWAGWIGLLVTSLNLLPAGQLDGGHVVYAMVGGRRHERVAAWVRLVVLAMGVLGLACAVLGALESMAAPLAAAGLTGLVSRGSGMAPWLVWALLLHFVGRAHPPVEDESAALGRPRSAVGWISLAVLVLTLTPVIWSPVEP